MLVALVVHGCIIIGHAGCMVVLVAIVVVVAILYLLMVVLFVT